jgi:hypothetical protein
MKKFFTTISAIVLISIGVWAIPALSTTPSKVISGCVNTKTGALRISVKCLKGETKLSWNNQGLPGPSGPSGPPGPSGSPGPSASAIPSITPNQSLVVLDANNQVVGYPLGITGTENYSLPNYGLNASTANGLTIFIPSINKVVALLTNGEPFPQEIYFATTDCTGQAYNAWPPEMPMDGTTVIYVKGGSLTGWWASVERVAGSITLRSKMDSFGTCNPMNSNVTSGYQKYAQVLSPLPVITGPIRLAVR